MESRVSIAALQSMKREGRKIVGVVAWDAQIASIADRAGVDLISVGDSVGVNLWDARRRSRSPSRRCSSAARRCAAASSARW